MPARCPSPPCAGIPLPSKPGQPGTAVPPGSVRPRGASRLPGHLPGHLGSSSGAEQVGNSPPELIWGLFTSPSCGLTTSGAEIILFAPPHPPMTPAALARRDACGGRARVPLCPSGSPRPSCSWTGGAATGKQGWEVTRARSQRGAQGCTTHAQRGLDPCPQVTPLGNRVLPLEVTPGESGCSGTGRWWKRWQSKSQSTPAAPPPALTVGSGCASVSLPRRSAGQGGSRLPWPRSQHGPPAGRRKRKEKAVLPPLFWADLCCFLSPGGAGQDACLGPSRLAELS